MSGELVSFLSAHGKRVQELFAVEVQAMDGRAPSATGAPRPDAFMDAVVVALGDDNIAPLISLFGLGGREPQISERLDRALRHLACLDRALHLAAREQQPPFALGGELSVLARRVAVKVTDNLVEQLEAGTAGARGPSLSITMHELRRPLTILSSYGQLLATGVLGPLPESAQVAIEGITASTEMMVRMVSALAEVSRLEDPDDRLILEEMDVEDLVSGSIEQIGMEAQLREIRLRRVVPSNVQIRCDRRRMTLALTNLVGNAVKHSPTGSEVIIATAALNGSMQFTVTDQGPGFPAEDTAHLFDKYFRSVAERQRKVPGSGLGLFIVKTIAERHHGSVTAGIAAGGGAEFALTIPVSQENP